MLRIIWLNVRLDVLKDIVRNCEFRSVPSDNVIIKQGDKGDW